MSHEARESLRLEERRRFDEWYNFFAEKRLSGEPLQSVLNQLTEKLPSREQNPSREIPQVAEVYTAIGQSPSLRPTFNYIITDLQEHKDSLYLQLNKALEVETRNVLAHKFQEIRLEKVEQAINQVVEVLGAVTVAKYYKEFYLGQSTNFSQSEIGAFDMFQRFVEADAPMAMIKGSLANIALNQMEIRFAMIVLKSGLKKPCDRKFAASTIIEIFARCAQDVTGALENNAFQAEAEEIHRHVAAPRPIGM